MKNLLVLLVLVVVLTMTACSTLQGDLAKLGSFTEVDMATALDQATKDQDQAGVNCWTFLLGAVKSGQLVVLPRIEGAASAIEAKRHFTNNPQLQALPTQINIACAALFNSEVATIGKIARMVTTGMP